ncbi:MAG: MBL fold metallo-hydrolase [Acidimicrobiia bacterium]|nr:MBL fold metallo-hydrolase [Acidimicrobiia bacterium]
MFVKRCFEPLIAQASYLIGCHSAGEAIVIDANRDIEQYVTAAEQAGLRITLVTETHIHADYASGSQELAQRTGASLGLSDEGGADWKYLFPHDRRLKHGDRMTLGNVKVDVLHTPGHTPEHLAFLITDGAAADRPIAAVTGDFVFVGDVGRPDLLEKAAKIAGTMESAARTLWHSLQAFANSPDWLQIWPGHGAGSACGKGISAIPHSTLGYERLFNWAFNVKSEDEFVARVLSGQPDPPPYFAVMKTVNKQGLQAHGLAGPQGRPTLDEVLAQGHLVVDTRPAEQFAESHRHGVINIPLNGSFVTWAGWLIPYDRDFFVITDRCDEVRRALRLIGLDRIAGHFPEFAGPGGQSVPQMSVDQLNGAFTVIDVRNDNEWKAGHIPSAMHIPLGRLQERIVEVPADKPVVVQCQMGGRSAIAASILQKLGRTNVTNLAGGYAAWEANQHATPQATRA